MPRKVDPGTIRSGSGLTITTSDSDEDRSELFKHMTSNPSHPASHISVEDLAERYTSGNVEGALEELSALRPPSPPLLGSHSTLVGVSGIPDWGVLKLEDSKLDERPGASSSPINLAEAYGYWWTVGDPADLSPPFSVLGSDPITDPIFNVVDGLYTGGGTAGAYQGAYTPDVGSPNPIKQTMRVVASNGNLGDKPVVVSGAVYPADRGVLALLFWPARGSITDFVTQSLTDKCVAAILLGGGLTTACDGSIEGGIFYPGSGGNPFAYPGQATGQYSLLELHTGASDIDATPLPSPFDPGSANPAAGQVRIGTDPNAGVPVVAGGVPILGATTSATGGGNDNNFFRYRLPYLEDYSSTSGIRYTPTADKPRYFMKPAVSDTPGTNLTQAGNYDNLTKDYWSMQMARFRHRFLMDNTVLGATDPREDGSYLLLHFKTEAAFESLVRDGTAPADTDLYSANMADWAYAEGPTNIAADNSAAGNPIASGYHLIRSAIFEDPGVVGAVTTNEFDYVPGTTAMMWVSGVRYFIGQAGANPPFTITDLDFVQNGFWTNSYRTSYPGKTGDAYLGNMNPGVVSVATLSFGENLGVPSHALSGIISDPTFRKAQRCDLSFWELFAPNAALDGPLPADPLSFSFTTPQEWEFLGDINTPSFSQEAQPVMCLRRPLGHALVGTAVTMTPIPSADGNKILFNSTQVVNIGDTDYGNVTSGGLTGAGIALASTESDTKDVDERFLDEIYRYSERWDSGIPSYTQLRGPGLPGAPATLDLPVRAGNAVAPWDAASWVQLGYHLTDISSASGNEAQVAGLPFRSPDFNSLLTPVKYPFPWSGMLYYPQEDYTTGYRPDLATDGVTQFDYSGLAGDRTYVRAFDAAFSRSGNPTTPEGQPFFSLRVRGLEMSDFAYAGPGPGSNAIAVLVKIPGLTSWMDVGRNDGAGPSKQDPFNDGAGCKVVGPETFNSHNTEDRVVYCEVKINVGPSANLFKNSLNEVPILVKVIIKDTAQGRALNFAQGSYSDDTLNQRALVGLEIVRPAF